VSRSDENSLYCAVLIDVISERFENVINISWSMKRFIGCNGGSEMKFAESLGIKRWFVFELFRKCVIATNFIAGSVVPCVRNDTL